MTTESSLYMGLHELPADLAYLEDFTRPNKPIDSESSKDLSDNPDRRYRHGLVIGRFQPPHRGHIELFKNALNYCETITIGIGSANVQNEDNPFSAEIRKLLLERALRREGIRNRVTNIVPLDDYGNGPIWLDAALRRTGPVDVVMGGNEWVNNIFENAGYPVEHLPRHGDIASTNIRRQLRQRGRLGAE